MPNAEELTDGINAGHVTLSLLAISVIALVAYQVAILYKEGSSHGSDADPDPTAPVSLDGRAG